VEDFLAKLTEEGFGVPTRSLYFFWIDRFIIEKKDIRKDVMDKFVQRMADGRFIHKCEIFNFADEQYLVVCRFSLNLYDIVFFLPSREGYLSGKKYFMRIKGKIDLVSLRKLFKIFRTNVSTIA
jgi:hypothetical protein